MSKPKVTVYITCYNYEAYVAKAIESVLNQTFQDFELLVFDDGSTDNSKKVIKKYDNNPKVKLFFQENVGLAATSNNALKEAAGEYIVRLDADDYFDENALMVLSSVLDSKKVGLVYPDYYEMDEDGKALDIIRRKKIGEEVKLLDLPMHGACTMIRTQIAKDLGGYNEEVKVQDGYDFWVRFVQKHEAYNVNLPLFYYRKHSGSLTASSKKILDARKKIKENFVEKNGKKKRTCLIIPIRRASRIVDDLPLRMVAGKPLMSYVVEAALGTGADDVVVTTEDEEVARIAENLGAKVIMRPKELSAFNTLIEPTIKHVLESLEKPEIVGVLFFTSPLVQAKHLKEAVNTLIIYNCDSVVSVVENNRLHYSHEEQGMKPLFEKRDVKNEREFLYEESGAFVFSKAEAIGDSLLGESIGHVVLTEDEAIDIEDKFTLWIVEKILENRDEVENLDVKKISRGY